MSDPGEAERIDAEARDWFVRLRGEGARHRDAFESWYIAQPEHADAYDRVLATWQATAHLDRLQPGGTGPASRHGWRAPIAALAAIMLLMIGVGVASLAGIGGRAAEAFSLVTKVGEIRTDRLPDGTKVTLDTDSRVDAVFTTSTRRVRLLRGRARIVAASDPKRPIQLEIAAATIGGGGVVDLTRRAGRATVAMIGGASAVHVGSSVVPLSTDQEVVIADAAAPPAPTALSDGGKRWPSGMLSFDNAPLDDVVAEANRYSAARIVLEDAALAQRRFTGTFRAGNAAGLARMLSAAFHLSLSRRGDGSFVLSAPRAK
jgi:transmembrane sensor